MGIDAEMFVRTKATISDAEVRRLAWEVVEAFGAGRFWLWEREADDDDRRALYRIDRYEQDGPDIEPEPGETFLRLSPRTRYYGPSYERGDLPFLVCLAEWLELRIPDCEVWYGGDSSGVQAKRFGKFERAEMFAHFAKVGHRPYAGDPRTGITDDMAQDVTFRGYTLPGNPPDDWAYRICGFCNTPMMRNGWGGSYARLECYGCGEVEQTNDKGETWTVECEVGGHKPRTAV